MSDTRPISFEAIEYQKENIQPLREGRSAAALVRVFAAPTLELRESQERERDQYEAQIADTDDLDDPLQPFLDYIDWVLENFPTGQNAESGLIQLLERCTSQFRDTAHYKDDPRYLKVWTRYINYSDAPREMFIYIARKDIGKNLALFYEEYAAFLETNGKRLQAKEVYEAGIQILARPITRLKRKYKEFMDRLQAQPLAVDEDESPALPVARAALSVKESATTFYSPSEGSSSAPSARSSREKLRVFNDPTNKHTEKSGGAVLGSGGWDSIGSLAARRKENVMEAKSWVGETLESTVPAPRTKLAIYKDSSPQSGLKQPEPVAGKRPEHISISLDFMNDGHGEEYCLEEVLARSRKILDLSYPHPAQKVSLKDDEDDLPPRPASPTMTMHTKAATEEIYEMFNQPLQSHSTDGDTSEDGEDFGDNSDLSD